MAKNKPSEKFDTASPGLEMGVEKPKEAPKTPETAKEEVAKMLDKSYDAYSSLKDVYTEKLEKGVATDRVKALGKEVKELGKSLKKLNENPGVGLMSFYAARDEFTKLESKVDTYLGLREDLSMENIGEEPGETDEEIEAAEKKNAEGRKIAEEILGNMDETS